MTLYIEEEHKQSLVNVNTKYTKIFKMQDSILSNYVRLSISEFINIEYDRDIKIHAMLEFYNSINYVLYHWQ